MKKIIFFFSMFLMSISLFSQEEVNLKNGKTIIVNPNGTWTYKHVNADNNSFIDSRDGHVYKTVTIGTQTWMAENLAYKTGIGCWAFDNDQKNVLTYGYLYNWETANNVCPIGWHLPSNSEWDILIDYLGGKAAAGQKMKNINGWEDGVDQNGSFNSNGTNSSGFSCLPGGTYQSGEWGGFGNIGINGVWWSATVYDNINAWTHQLCSNFKTLDCFNQYFKQSGYNNKSDGCSIRCIKD